MSCPCAQVSISRAVAIEVALIGGPNQAIFSPAGTCFNASASSARVSRQYGSSWSVGSAAPSAAPLST